jgi:nicotinamide-nucleotide amidase
MITAELLTVTPDPGLATGTAPPLARVLQAGGVPVRACRVVVAEDAEVERALRQTTEVGGLVIVLGDGEGAEVARQALARHLGSRLVLNDRMLDAVAAAHARRGQAMPRRAERLALVPQGATVLVAADGGEPGLVAETDGAVVALLPADVTVATALVREHLLARVPRRGAEPVTLVRTLRLAGLGVSDAEARLGAALREVEGVSARLAEVDGEVWVRLRLGAPTADSVRGLFAECAAALRAELGVAWYGDDEETLELVVGRLLRDRRLTIALAESCTGGLVGHRLTQVPGSSAYLERGLVVYSNAAKQALLGVPDAVLAEHGAVSAECAEAMAQGVRRHAGTDLGLSVTGIAGPDGATPTKPVGLTFIGLADAAGATVHRYRFDRDREGNKALAAMMALDLVRRYCLVAR